MPTKASNATNLFITSCIVRTDGYVSADEACRYITEELGLSETKAKKLVNKINTRYDSKIAKSDLEAIKDKIANA